MDHIYAVSEVNGLIKDLIDGTPQLSGLYIRGELSNYKILPLRPPLLHPEGRTERPAVRDVQKQRHEAAVPAGKRHAGGGVRPDQRVPPGRRISAVLHPAVPGRGGGPVCGL